MTHEELATPLTEIEKADLLRAASQTDRCLNYEAVTRLRRALFEIDTLRERVESWKKLIEHWESEAERGELLSKTAKIDPGRPL